ncbi:hypothetical protein [Streptomyces sp. NPDC020965]|uniref:hypothetical protein n=1 Tax=Streptomyces sp. NPDC020965 TaxID=3365105 RepID=UPI003797397A
MTRINRLLPVVSAAVLLAAGTAALLPGAAQARESVVPCDGAALVAAVDAANAAGGGIIPLTPQCTYTLNSAHGADPVHGPSGLPVITTEIRFEGDGSEITRGGAAAFRIAQVAASGNLSLKGTRITNGSATGAGSAGHGGGVLNLGLLTVANSIVSGNSATGSGGGVYSANGTVVTIKNSTVSGNTAAGSGGGVHSGTAAATIKSTAVSSNTATGDGGGFYGSGLATVGDSPFTANKGARGGAIASVGGNLTVTNSPVIANTATVTAGAIFRLGGTATVSGSPLIVNAPNNCAGSAPAVPGCLG